MIKYYRKNWHEFCIQLSPETKTPKIWSWKEWNSHAVTIIKSTGKNKQGILIVKNLNNDNIQKVQESGYLYSVPPKSYGAEYPYKSTYTDEFNRKLQKLKDSVLGTDKTTKPILQDLSS